MSTNSQVTLRTLAEVVSKAGPQTEAIARAKVEAWEKGLREEGRLEGRGEGLAAALVVQLEHRFAEVTPAQRSTIEHASSQQLMAWLRKWPEVESVDALLSIQGK